MLKELGDYKNRLRSIFVNSDNICKLLLGKDYENAEYDLDDELDKYIIPHLYVPDIITTQNSYIMFDTFMPRSHGKIKTMKIAIQAICHKDIVKYEKKPKGYPGLRYDVLAQFIEELLCPKDEEANKSIIKKFGIGSMELELVDVFLDKNFIGRTLTFTVPDFR